MKFSLSLLCLLVCGAPVSAQPRLEPGVKAVEDIKADLLARRVDVSGPCGAFQITKRVAWALRDHGAGLHHKPAGNNCEGYSVDFIILRDRAIDVLRDGGVENGPIFDDHGVACAGCWRPPFDPGDLPSAEPVPTEGAGTNDGSIDVMTALIGDFQADQNRRLESLQGEVRTLREQSAAQAQAILEAVAAKPSAPPLPPVAVPESGFSWGWFLTTVLTGAGACLSTTCWN